MKDFLNPTILTLLFFSIVGLVTVFNSAPITCTIIIIIIVIVATIETIDELKK